MIVTTKNKTEDKKSESDSDAANFKVVAEVEKVTVILSSMDRHVGKVDVKGKLVSWVDLLLVAVAKYRCCLADNKLEIVARSLYNSLWLL